MTQAPGTNDPTPPPGPEPGAPSGRRGALAVVGAVVGGLALLAALIVGAVVLVDSRDEPIETDPTPTASDTAPEPAGELHEMLLEDADVVTDADGETWLLDEAGWVESPDTSAEAVEAYTGTFAADSGAVTLTALSFADEEAATAYLDQVREDSGEPDYEGAVWEDGSGTRFDYESGEESTVYWRDDASMLVFSVAGPTGAAESFYAGLPF
ncbi:hypothetical protein [Ruania alba]|uniref:Uncharacterized protein n=1 Tax=Ruania alba TaxID=648782 RepID=A0A1H5NDR0_9MICO|nr:hypothetical protein [Ruania alba]SEE99695.1 hypothetical protein SAMN04488554_4231 [Ruania alba]